ncbi:hypothetical protein [Sporolituus thermophilus]|uniref:Nitrite/Sulfite reductase ferredoxin-like half domain-containing protein n=1 Tax=Sporolituus thermophilus DSM 23256 TaxID=1123285 RepID=A0A1G7MFS2_9FIRM|nr:hypothetical protein [Sporolituus thermophilus]SDF60577.1 Nitrite/Sulfite reductase ferredoxin-like half domain-containing protein [Sporolituus thermophilus DSM 23256]
MALPPLANIPFLNKRVKFPVTPHIPGGLTTPEQLRQIAAVAEKYGGRLKIVGNGITIMGLSLADGEKALAELGCKPESFIAKSVRAVAMCPGKPDCPMAQQDSTALGLALDSEFFGQQAPGKVRIGVSGCPNCCAEVFVKDIGVKFLPSPLYTQRNISYNKNGNIYFFYHENGESSIINLGLIELEGC